MHLSTLCAQFVDKLNRAEGINRREFVNKVVSTHIRRMTQMEYSFNIYNKMAGAGILMALNAYIGTNEAPPVILCIGSDLAIGDSLGPVCGTMLQNKNCYKGCFVYGTLKKPVTAKEVKYLNAFLKETRPNSKIIAVDAAVGAAGDIGLIKINNKGLKPGLGANKKLPAVGDVSIMGIVAEKSLFNYSLLNLTRLNLVYKMSDIISDSLATFLMNAHKTSMRQVI